MSPRQQSEITTSSIGKGKKVKEGYSPLMLMNLRLPFQLQLMNLTLLGFGDEAVSGATDTLAAAQGVGGEAVEDEDQEMVF